MVKFGIEFVPGTCSVKQVVDYSIMADQANIDFAWITNLYNHRHYSLVLGAIAQATDRIKMGPAVLNFFSETPAMMASFYCTLNEMSQGRAVMGIGPGDLSTLNRLAIQTEKPIDRVLEGVAIFRRLCMGQEITHQEEFEFFDYDGVKLTGVELPDDILVYIGAQGPKMFEMAGAIGDGALINASNLSDFEVAVPRVREACAEVGKNRFDIGAYTALSIDLNEEKARRAGKIVAAFIAAGSPLPLLERHGIDPYQVRKIKDAIVQRDFQTVGRLVTDNIIDAFTISGGPDTVRQKIDELQRAGVTQVIFGSPLGPDIGNSIRILGKYVI